MENASLSWGVVYVIIFLPAVLMLCNFVFGNCFLSAELGRQQHSTQSMRTRARVLGRGCIALVIVSFVWQYGVFMFASRPQRARECNVAFFLWDVIDAVPTVWLRDYSALFICSTSEVVYQLTFLLFMSLYLLCVLSVPQVMCSSDTGTLPDGDSRQEALCSYCSKCAATVLGMDHHCYLIGNCVGQRNRRLFITFLASGVLNLTVLLGSRGQWALTEGGPITLVGLLLVISFSLFLAGLLAWQVLLASCGYTTLLFLKTARERRLSKWAMLASLAWPAAAQHEKEGVPCATCSPALSRL